MEGLRSENRSRLSGDCALIDTELLSLLACPLCDVRPPLRLQGADLLVCTVCGHGFPIVNEIPHLLPEEAISPEKIKESNDAGNLH